MEKEKWKPVLGYEKKYEVSNLGNLKSLTRISMHSKGSEMILNGKTLKPQKDSGGYLFFRAYNKNVYENIRINILVYKTFKDDYDPNLVVDHKNNIRTDNRLINLQQLSNRDNIIKQKKSNTGITGVYLTHRNTYNTKIQFEGRNIDLGTFKTIEEAKNKYDAFKLKNNII